MNEYLQSVSNPAVYAAGDAANTGFPLTPIAAMEGRAVAANLLQGNHQTVDYTGIPSAVFTVPALARVGLLESEAHELGLKVRVKYASVPNWYTARRLNELSYAHKVLVEEKTDRLLGAHLLGPDAAEVANIFWVGPWGIGGRSGSDSPATCGYPETGSSRAREKGQVDLVLGLRRTATVTCSYRSSLPIVASGGTSGGNYSSRISGRDI